MLRGLVASLLPGDTGALIHQTVQWYGAFGATPYGSLARPIQADADAQNEIWMSFGVTEGFVGVWEFDPDGVAQERWRHLTDSRFYVSGPLDMDGDKVQELVLSQWLQGVWVTSVLDAGTGETRASLSGYVATVGTIDSDGDGKAELVVSKQSAEELSDLSELRAFKLSGGELVAIWNDPIGRAALVGTADQDGDGQDELVVVRDASGDGVRDSLHLYEGR